MRIESFLRGLVVGMLATLLATGLYTIVQPIPSPTAQFVQLGHDLVGYMLLPVGLVYVALHLRQTIDARWLTRRLRSSTSTLGRPDLLATLAAIVVADGLAALFVSSIYDTYPVGSAERAVRPVVLVIVVLVTTAAVAGLAFTLTALRRSGLKPLNVRWFLLLATAVSVATGVLLPVAPRLREAAIDLVWLLHVVTAFLGLALGAMHVASSRRATARRSSPPPRRYGWTRPMLLALVVALVTSGWTGWRAHRDGALVARPAVQRDAIVPVDEGFTRTMPAACEPCHAGETETWAGSAHAHAAANPLFEALLLQTARDAGPEMARFCLRCHAPHADDPTRVPVEDVMISEGFRAGVHCVSCHRATPGPGHGDGSFDVAPLSEARVMFLHEYPGRIGEEMRDSYAPWILIGSRLPLHRESFAFETDEARSCMPCHVQTLDVPTHGRLGLALQDQYDSWESSPAAAAGRDCRHCHMPRWRDAGARLRTDHRMRAASTYVAALAGGDEAVAEVLATLEGRPRALPVSLFDVAPGPPGPLLALRATRVERDDGTAIEIRTRNTGRIGHSFPNGPTDLMQIWLAATVRDADGRTLLEVGGGGPKGAPRLGHRLLDAEGRTVLDHRLWEVAELVDLGHVPADGEHVLELPLPGDPAGPLELSAAWRYRRLDPDLLVRMTGAPFELPVATVGSLSTTLR